MATRHFLPSGTPRTILVATVALLLVVLLVFALWVALGQEDVIAPTALPPGASPAAP